MSSRIDEILYDHFIDDPNEPDELSVKSAKQAILQWHNKQIEAVLDRLEEDCKLNYTTWGNSEKMLQVSGVLKRVEAERKRLTDTNVGNKLKESTDEDNHTN